MLDASGIIHVEGDRFLVAEDERDVLQYFVFNRQLLTFTASSNTIDFGQNESDFESIAFDSRRQRYYCIGSHGEDYSQRLLSFELVDVDLGARNTNEIAFDAQHLINEAVNIEALSVWDSQLFIGYRGPQRNKLALAVLFDMDSGAQLMTSFNLAGRTFRDVVRINDQNYLILAGPLRGKHYKKRPSRIFFWNGDVFSPQLIECKVDLAGYRAEGIAVRMGSDGSIDILVGTDESKIKSAKYFRMLYLNVSDIRSLTKGVHKPVEIKVEF